MLKRIKRKLLTTKFNKLDVSKYDEMYALSNQITCNSNEFEIDLNLNPLTTAQKNVLVNNLLKSNIPDLKYSAGQCLKWSVYLTNLVEESLKIKATPTLGQLWNGDKYLYNPSWSNIFSFLSNGFQISDLLDNATINFHVWITLENGQIIDFTLDASICDALKEDSHGSIRVGYPHQLIEDYVPMLSGRSVLRRVFTNDYIKFFAENTEELKVTPTLFCIK